MEAIKDGTWGLLADIGGSFKFKADGGKVWSLKSAPRISEINIHLK
jgi:hypothetical protein